MRRSGAALLVASTFLLVSASGASAASVQVVGEYYKPIHEADRVDYIAAPGEVNDVVVTLDGDVVTIRDVVPIEPGVGCISEADGSVRCTVTAGLPRSGRVRLGDGDDRARVSGTLVASLRGGAGDDRLFGAPDSGVSFWGDAGDDLMVGGSQGGYFNEGAAANGSDTMLSAGGGLGVDYGARRHGVHADAGGDRDDGERGERDRIGPGVASLIGGSGPDVLIGGPGRNVLEGREGKDLLRGGGGPDHLTGDTWIIDKPRSADRVFGGSGDDHIETGAGADRIAAGTGRDSVVAGPGPDRVDTRDSALDAVVCGLARDRVSSDGHDFLTRGCERHGAFARQPIPMVFADAGEVASVLLGCPLDQDCTGNASVELDGQILGTTHFSLPRGSYRFIYVPLAGRSSADHQPPIDDAILHVGTRTYAPATLPDFFIPLDIDL
jgi:Ca2+-binding RTX toxin-like protein